MAPSAPTSSLNRRDKLSSLDLVAASELNAQAAAIEDRMSKVIAAVRPDGNIAAKSIDSHVQAVIDLLPDEIEQEMGNLDKLKTALKKAITEFINGNNVRSERGREVATANLALKVERVLNNYYTHKLVNSPVEHGHDLLTDPNVDPTITNSYCTLSVRQAVANVIFVGTAYTTFMGASQLAGYGIDETKELLALPNSPNFEIALRMAIASITGVALSAVVYKKKDEIIRYAQDNHTGFTRAALNVTKAAATASLVGAALTVGTGAALGVDGYTNMTGIATIFGKRADNTAQIEDARVQLLERLENAQKQSKRILKSIPQDVEADARKIMDDEEAGEGVSQTDGVGVIYYAKDAVYMEDPSSKKELANSTNQYGIQLQAALDSSDLVDGRPIHMEVEDIVAENIEDVVFVQLEKAAMLIDSLDPGQDIEFIQAQIDEVVNIIDTVISVMNKDLPGQLEDHLERYDDLNKEIARIAVEKYPDAKMDVLKDWDVPEFEMENDEIKINSMQYKGGWELYKGLSKNAGPVGAAIIGMLILLGAVAASWLDALATKAAANVYALDRAEAKEKEENFIAKIKAKVIEIIVSAMNKGPFSTRFKDDSLATNLDPIYVAAELDKTLSAMADKNESGSAKRHMSILAGGRTDVRRRHNLEVAALLEFLRRPELVGAFLDKLLPGNEVASRVDSTQPGAQRDTTIDANNTSIMEANVKLEREELLSAMEIANSIESIGKDATEATGIMAKAKSAINTLRLFVTRKTQNDVDAETFEAEDLKLAANAEMLSELHEKIEKRDLVDMANNGSLKTEVLHIILSKRMEIEREQVTRLYRKLDAIDIDSSMDEGALLETGRAIATFSASNFEQFLSNPVSQSDSEHIKTMKAAIEDKTKEVSAALQRHGHEVRQAGLDKQAAAVRSQEAQRVKSAMQWAKMVVREGQAGERSIRANRLFRLILDTAGPLHPNTRVNPNVLRAAETSFNDLDAFLERKIDQTGDTHGKLANVRDVLAEEMALLRTLA